ncbi:lipid-transfer protein [Sphingobium sp.]|uniref:lipid-transfer protein n=1 Tax=Sphingobium sp. TaxID=1912891 RepID=UPI0028BE490F|nr:lipid-transfer protein [Sphingobium sp.]
MELSRKASIVGIGQTEFSKNSGRSELRLCTEAVTAALADAGISPHDVDGFVSFCMDNNTEGEVARALGMRDLTYFGRVDQGGGACGGTILQAAMAVATGAARTVVCWRAMNERSGARFGQPSAQLQVMPDPELTWMYVSQGLQSAASYMAVMMRRYMYETGATREDFGRIALAARKHAAINPHAWFHGQPISMEDYLASRPIAEPLCLLDCCQETDGGVAFVITSTQRARDLRQKPVLISAAAQGIRKGTNAMACFYRADISPRDEVRLVGDQLYAKSNLTSDDIDVAIIYDHFGPSVMPALEALGFCEYGEAKDFIRDGGIELGGHLPVNTHGGQVGEGYIHGMNGVLEAVRQVRGTAINQVETVNHVMVTGASGVPTSGAILSAL